MEYSDQQTDFLKGRGAQVNTHNPYLAERLETEHIEGLDEPLLENSPTTFIPEYPNKIINKVESPDIPLPFSMNPYQGCEHGCVYCYARNTHQYWGYSAGLDFERKIIVKPEAPELLEAALRKPSWEPKPIMFSGNTDCYQPAERKYQLTRKMLEVLLKYRHPVGMITKNSLILRDLDLLSEMAKLDLVHVAISITTLDEGLRKKLEPRTAAGKTRLKVVQKLSEAGIPVTVMAAPIIPALNHFEIPAILKGAAEAGARSCAYTMVRLNGAVAQIFEDWIRKVFPDRADKVLNQISSLHGGKLGDARFGTRMRGEGNHAEAIRHLFHVSREKHFKGQRMPPYNLDLFQVPGRGKQLNLF